MEIKNGIVYGIESETTWEWTIDGRKEYRTVLSDIVFTNEEIAFDYMKKMIRHFHPDEVVSEVNEAEYTLFTVERTQGFTKKRKWRVRLLPVYNERLNPWPWDS